MNSHEAVKQEEGAVADSTGGLLFSIYYLGNLAHTLFIKQPWIARGLELTGDAKHYQEQVQEGLKQMVQTGDGTQLIGPKLRERVDDLEELCNALVLNSRAQFFAAKAAVWDAESVEMFLTWNDDWLEDMLRGWDRPRKDPPTQAARVAEVIKLNWEQTGLPTDECAGLLGEEEASILLHRARCHRILFNNMRAMGTTWADCGRMKRGNDRKFGRKPIQTEREKESRNVGRKMLKERQKLTVVCLRSYRKGFLLLAREMNDRDMNGYLTAQRMIAQEVLSDTDQGIKAIKDKVSKLGVNGHLIDTIMDNSRELYLNLHERWCRAIYLLWARPIKRLKEAPLGAANALLWLPPILPLLSKKIRRDVAEANELLLRWNGPFSWKRMMEPEQLNAFGDGTRKSFTPTEFMERVFSDCLVNLTARAIESEVRALEDKLAEVAKYATKVKNAVSAVNVARVQQEVRQLDTLIKTFTVALNAAAKDASSTADKDGEEPSVEPLFRSIIGDLVAARDAVVEAISKSEAQPASNARAKQAEAASKSETQPASNARAKQEVPPPPAGMVLIPAGKFQSHIHLDVRGPASRIRTRSVKDFYIDTHLVTCEEFKEFLDENSEWQLRNRPHGDDSDYPPGWIDWPGDVDRKTRWKNVYPPGKANHPVQVSWEAAKAYAEWKGKRLPTVLEWEKAARGGLANKAYPWGNTISIADQTDSGYTKDLDLGGPPVGSYAPNGYGLYDVVGSWEYCEDNLLLNDKLHVWICGGDWCIDQCRPVRPDFTCVFRCVQDVER